MTAFMNVFKPYTKLPVTIEATEYLGSYHTTKETLGGIITYDSNGIPYISTLEGYHCVSIGDMIIRGVKGEYYPCKPDIFALTYEAAE